jgi:hypothetical protein
MSARYPYDELEDIDRPFWYGRDSLQHIFQFARERLVSPWAVFAHSAANVLSTIPPHITLPPLIGGPGSLNMLLSVVARSGGGKDAAAAAADTLTPVATEIRNLGSGEGLVEAYRIPGDKKAGIEDQQRPALRFVADEVDAVLALGSRSGSTILPTLRSAFNAKQLGATTIRSGGFHLPDHSYRLTLVMSVQPTRAGWLFDDAGGGTPQRFMWLPAKDPRSDGRIGEDRVDETPLPLPAFADWGTLRRSLKVPPVVSDYVRNAAVRRNQDDEFGDELDGHAVFMREKLAMALAVLDGRTEMSESDWSHSGIAMEVSDLTRGWIEECLGAERMRIATETGERQGWARVASREAEHVFTEVKVARCARRIIRYAADHHKADPTKAMARNQLLKKFNAHERPWFNEALTLCLSSGAVEVDRHGGYWPPECVPVGLARPADAKS